MSEHTDATEDRPDDDVDQAREDREQLGEEQRGADEPPAEDD